VVCTWFPDQTREMGGGEVEEGDKLFNTVAPMHHQSGTNNGQRYNWPNLISQNEHPSRKRSKQYKMN